MEAIVVNISELGIKIQQIISSDKIDDTTKTNIRVEFYEMMLADLKWEQKKEQYAKQVNAAFITAGITPEETVNETVQNIKAVQNEGMRVKVQPKQEVPPSNMIDEDTYEVDIQ
jgi:hypothetical protein